MPLRFSTFQPEWLRPLLIFSLAPAALTLRAQPVAPTPGQVEWLRSFNTVKALTAPGPALSVAPSGRAASRAFFNAIYSASEGVPIDWTGSLSGTPGVSAAGAPGDTSSAYKTAVQLRINWFRAMAGVPAVISLNDTWSAEDQQAALMMAANNTLSHTPPTNWLLYTAAGATAAGNSNLALGNAGPDAITAYVLDYGGNNTALGHRRWILYPQTQTMGTGDIPGTGTFFSANATWVLDGNYGGTRPATRESFVAWPPPGYVPYQVVFPRWSFSYPNADFSTATVTMTSGESSVPVAIDPLDNPAYGENTIGWVWNGLDATADDSPAARPGADTAYHVQVNGVKINGVPQNFSYTVTLFDPAVAGPDDTLPEVAASATVVTGQSNAYTVTGNPSFANGFEWRTVSLAPFSGSYGAEGGLQGVIASTTGGYSSVDPNYHAAGSASYYLAQPTPDTQTLTLPGSDFSAGSTATLQFESQLGYATSTQTAHVQVSLDDGNSWADVYTQSGTGDQGETSFTPHTVSLAAYAGRVIQVRFAYTYDGGSYYYQTSGGVGWHIDSITFSGVSAATVDGASAFSSGSTFDFTPTGGGSTGLQARAMLFGTYPVEWGPLNSPTLSVTQQPSSVTAGAGQTAVFSVTATDAIAFSCQWNFNGAPLSGATDRYLVLANVQAANAGDYTCTLTDSSGALTSAAASLVLSSSTDLGRIVNLSIRDNCGTGADSLIAGFVIGGTGTDGSAKTLLVRAGGPVLIPYGVTGVLADPNLAVHQLSSGGDDLGVVAANDNWAGNSLVISTGTQVGAFAWPDTGSLDAALVTSLAPGPYTANITGNNGGTGVALAEVYDATTSFTATTPRLINVSGRAQVASGASSLIAGFVIGGSTEKTVLVRGLGPVLANYGVTGVLADPQLVVHKINSNGSDGGVIASDSAWGGDPALTAIFTSVGASPLSNSASADTALLVSLPPGVYTANVTSAGNSTGVALVEVYEVP